MSCGEARELLVPWLDGELPPDTALRVSGHVAQCSACPCEVELHRRVGSTLDAVYAARPGTGQDIILRVRQQLERDRLDSSRRTLRRVVLGVAASVLIAVGAWWLVSSQSVSPGDGQDLFVGIGAGEVAAEEELLENLDVLEALEAEGIDLTPELVQVLLDEDEIFGVEFDDDELDEIFKYVLEEEVLSDQL